MVVDMMRYYSGNDDLPPGNICVRCGKYLVSDTSIVVSPDLQCHCYDWMDCRPDDAGTTNLSWDDVT